LVSFPVSGRPLRSLIAARIPGAAFPLLVLIVLGVGIVRTVITSTGLTAVQIRDGDTRLRPS